MSYFGSDIVPTEVVFFGDDFEIILIGRLVVLVAQTKRAQVPFTSWLPATIAASKIVSALVQFYT